MEGFYRKSFQVTSDWLPDSSSEISSFLVWNRVRRRYCIKSHLCLVLHSLLIISVAMIRRKMLVKKDVCHLVTSMGQRKKFLEESKSKSPWGIEPQTFRFWALMLYHWATETPWWVRSITKFIWHASSILLGSAPSDSVLRCSTPSHRDSTVSKVYYKVRMTRVQHTARISNVNSIMFVDRNKRDGKFWAR